MAAAEQAVAMVRAACREPADEPEPIVARGTSVR
jgi:hypothetical protein